jgi:hypothetical protein
MPENEPFSTAEAEAFIKRHGLARLGPDQYDAMAAAMDRIAAAGQAVPRVASKFDAPAPVFRVRDSS